MSRRIPIRPDLKDAGVSDHFTHPYKIFSQVRNLGNSISNNNETELQRRSYTMSSNDKDSSSNKSTPKLATYLTNAVGPVSLVLVLLIT